MVRFMIVIVFLLSYLSFEESNYLESIDIFGFFFFFLSLCHNLKFPKNEVLATKAYTSRILTLSSLH